MITLSPTQENRFVVKRNFRYKEVLIPSGYKSNGANIPRLFWIIVPPFYPKFLPAVVLHDFLCDQEEYKKADDYFAELLFSAEKSMRTKAMVFAVRLYHRIKYGVK